MVVRLRWCKFVHGRPRNISRASMAFMSVHQTFHGYSGCPRYSFMDVHEISGKSMILNCYERSWTLALNIINFHFVQHSWTFMNIHGFFVDARGRSRTFIWCFMCAHEHWWTFMGKQLTKVQLNVHERPAYNNNRPLCQRRMGFVPWWMVTNAGFFASSSNYKE